MRTYDDWKSTEPDYMDYEEYDPQGDPQFQLEMTVHCLRSCTKDLMGFVLRDKAMVRSELANLHAAWSELGSVLSQFPNLLPQAAE